MAYVLGQIQTLVVYRTPAARKKKKNRTPKRLDWDEAGRHVYSARAAVPANYTKSAKKKKKKINGVVVEYSHQKLNIPLFFFPNGYTTRAAKNNPRVVPMAT